VQYIKKQKKTKKNSY